jgi:hypothetical protein
VACDDIRALEITRPARVLPTFESLDDALGPDLTLTVAGGTSGPVAMEANVLPETV